MQHGVLDAPIEIQRQGEDLRRQHSVIYRDAVQCIIVWCNYWDAPKEMGKGPQYIEGSVGDAQQAGPTIGGCTHGDAETGGRRSGAPSSFLVTPFLLLKSSRTMKMFLLNPTKP